MDTIQSKNSLIKARGKFTQIPNYIICKTDLSDPAFRTLCHLMSFCYKKKTAFPAQSTLATDRNKSVRSINKHIKEIESLGIIRIGKRGRGQSNIYTLTDEENFISETKISSTDIGRKLPINNTIPNNTGFNKDDKNENYGTDMCKKTIREYGLRK